MSRDQSIDVLHVTPEKVSVYLVPERGFGATEAITKIIKPDPTKGAMFQCDWDGCDNLGTFAVIGLTGWEQVGQLDTDGPKVQLVSDYHEVTQVHVQRGPANPGVRFAVKLVPIVWLIELTMPEDHGVMVVRGHHYKYKDGHTPETANWEHSSKDSDGTHVATWQGLVNGEDYEIWTKLWNPNNPDGSDDFKVQDPVLRTGANIPPNNNGPKSRDAVRGTPDTAGA